MKYRIDLDSYNCCDGECGNNFLWLSIVQIDDGLHREVFTEYFDFDYQLSDLEYFKEKA